MGLVAWFGMWLTLRRPLGIALILGCSISLMTSARLTLRLAIPAAIYWSFVPLCELAGLAAVCRGRLKPAIVDTYFRSTTVALSWVIAFSAAFAFLPTPQIINSSGFFRGWYVLASAALLW